MWQLRYNPVATAGIYTIPRGPAAIVTEGIRSLLNNPIAGEPIEGKENIYKITLEGYTVEYELREEHDPKLIIILHIE